MSTQTYLMIDLLSVLVPLAASFHPAIGVYRRWGALLPAIICTAFFYVIWDAWFIHLGVWGFNRRYITGYYIGNLPVEEVLFFFCIPYACVFTFDSFSALFAHERFTSRLKTVNYCLSAVFMSIALLYHTKHYTAAAFGLPALLILFTNFFKTTWLLRFYLVYAILLIPFLIVNGLLTGTGLAAPVVWYNPNDILGPRILSIPVEDVFYGMGLVLLNVWLYQVLLQRYARTLHLPKNK